MGPRIESIVNRFFKEFASLGSVIHQGVDAGRIVIGCGVSWFQLNGPGVIFDGHVVLFFHPIRVSTIDVGLEIIFI